jgi:mono/diheme cytochrome c family protein
MTKAAIKWLIVANVIVGFNVSGWAQDSDAGKTAYLSSCAPCHGVDAKGAGCSVWN